MSNRQPRIIGIYLHRDDGVPSIQATIAYDGLKGDQIDIVQISPKHAARLVQTLGIALAAFIPEGGVK